MIYQKVDLGIKCQFYPDSEPKNRTESWENQTTWQACCCKWCGVVYEATTRVTDFLQIGSDGNR